KPGDMSRSAAKLGAACQETLGPWPVLHHRLERRSIENYLPGEALGGGTHKRLDDDEWADYGRTVDAFMKLTTEQKHHFNMKNGLIGDVADGKKRRHYREGGHPIADGDLPDLFWGLPADMKEALRRGFGATVADLYHDEGNVRFVDEAALQREAAGER